MEKSKIIEKLFLNICTFAYLLLPLLVLVFNIKTKTKWVIFSYGIIFCGLLFFYRDFPKYFRVNYFPTVYTFVEYVFFASIIYLNIQNKKFKAIIFSLSLLFFCFQFYYLFGFEKNRTDSISIGIESVLIFTYIIYFVFEKLTSQTKDSITSNYCFWISVGILIYLGGSFFINILANHISEEDFRKYWFLNYIADTAKTLFFAFSLFVLKNRSKLTLHLNK